MITATTLDHGLTLLVEPIEGVRSAALTWLVPAGTAEEPADRLGLSAMWAELLVRGAGSRRSREHVAACDLAGLNRGVENTTRFMRVSGSLVGSEFARAFPLIADMVLRPRFDADAIDPSRDLVFQAIEGLRDDPGERATIGARSRHFPSPLNRPTLGTREGLAAINRSDVKAHWSRLARPSGSILAVAGAIDPGEVEGIVRAGVKGWAGTGAVAPVLGAGPRGYAHEADDSAQVQIVVMQDAPLASEPDAILERVVASVLSGGMSGRLFTEVREKRGLCYSVSASYSPGKETGAIVSYVGTTPERAQESLDVLAAELDRLASPEGRVATDEFDRAIIGLRTRVVFHGESTPARASALASDRHALGRARTLEDVLAEIDAVTLDRVNDYLARRGTRVRAAGATIQTVGTLELRPPASLAGRGEVGA